MTRERLKALAFFTLRSLLVCAVVFGLAFAGKGLRPLFHEIADTAAAFAFGVFVTWDWARLNRPAGGAATLGAEARNKADAVGRGVVV